MRRGPDGLWRTVGGIVVSKTQQKHMDKKSVPTAQPETIHTLHIVNPKAVTYPILERECRIVVTDKITWAEPLMPIRGTARSQKRFMVGAFAFYTKQQAERKKLIMLVQAMKAPAYGMTMRLHNDAWKQYEQYKLTGEVK